MESARGLISYLSASPTAFHATRAAHKALADAGFKTLSVDSRWKIEPGGRYLLPLGDGAIVAVRLGRTPLAESGASILVAHTDSPALKVKERGASWRKGYLGLPTELYGGPIVSTWIDRELGIAGRVVGADGTVSLVDLPLRVVIPNLAVHLNRKVNEGFAYNAQDHLVALAGAASGREDANAESELRALVAEAAGMEESDVFEYELSLYEPTPGTLVGADGDILVAPRIDNLSGSYTCLEAFLRAESDRPSILVLFNHEEIGSLTGEGAQSGSLSRVIERLVRAEGGDAEDAEVAAARSLIVSNDVAHALHPSFADKYDKDYAPVMNGGPVLKVSGTLKYATTAATGVHFRRACEAAGVPMQRSAFRSDARSGSTVGPISWARTGIPTVDIGLGILAMHAIRETAGAADVEMTIQALTALVNGA
jgi:aspartyl aminopeptidase